MELIETDYSPLKYRLRPVRSNKAARAQALADLLSQ